MPNTPESNSTRNVADDTNTELTNDLDASRRQEQQPQIRRIFRVQRPMDFRLGSNAQINTNTSATFHQTTSTFVQNNTTNNNPDHRASLNGNRNGNQDAEANGNTNAQRFRLNIGGRGPVVLQQRRRQLQHPVQQSQRQRITIGQRGSSAMGGNGPVPVQVRAIQVQVDPLIPQPLSASTSSNAATNMPSVNSEIDERPEDPPDYERFKCEICYEYMADPVGCGKCSSRFCRPCLQRVFASDKQNHSVTRCPVCRCEYNEIVPDHGLYRQTAGGENPPTLPCRYVSIGCSERKVPLSQIAIHEQTCDHAPMRCRYAPYGCTWTGKRCLLRSHEEYSCKLAPLGQLVEQFRQHKADQTMRLEMITQQATGAVRMSHVLRQTYTRDNQRKSLSDVFRLFQYCHVMTSMTPHFLMTKDLWVSYWRNHESRAAIVNFCTLVPFIATTVGVVAHGATDFLSIFEEATTGKILSVFTKMMEVSNGTITDRKSREVMFSMLQKFERLQSEELIENSLLGICTCILGFLVIMLTFMDRKSSVSWDKISLAYFGGKFPLVGDAVRVSILTLVSSIIEYHQSGMKAKILWYLLLPMSTFFPAMILSISYNTARLVTRTPAPAPFNMMKIARLVEPAMFGLRFSYLMSFFGTVPTLDASVAVCVIPQTSRMYLKNSFFEHIPRSFCLFYLGAKSSYQVYLMKSLLFDGELDWKALKYTSITGETAQAFFASSPDGVALSDLFDKIFLSISATLFLMATSFAINYLFSMGIMVGDIISQSGQTELNASNIARGTAKEYSMVGLPVFAIWVITNMFLAFV